MKVVERRTDGTTGIGFPTNTRMAPCAGAGSIQSRSTTCLHARQEITQGPCQTGCSTSSAVTFDWTTWAGVDCITRRFSTRWRGYGVYSHCAIRRTETRYDRGELTGLTVAQRFGRCGLYPFRRDAGTNTSMHGPRSSTAASRYDAGRRLYRQHLR